MFSSVDAKRQIQSAIINNDISKIESLINVENKEKFAHILEFALQKARPVTFKFVCERVFTAVHSSHSYFLTNSIFNAACLHQNLTNKYIILKFIQKAFLTGSSSYLINDISVWKYIVAFQTLLNSTSQLELLKLQDYRLDPAPLSQAYNTFLETCVNGKDVAKRIGLIRNDESAFPTINGGTSTGVCFAAQRGDIETLEILYKEGCDFNGLANEPFEKLTPLMVACGSGQLDTVKFLIEKCNVSFQNLPMQMSGLPLSEVALAALGGHVEILEYLKSRGINLNAISYSNVNTCLPLWFACASGKVYAVQFLLDELMAAPIITGNPTTTIQINKDAILITAACIAAENGHVYVIKLLEKHIATLNSCCPPNLYGWFIGEKPLTVAFKNGQPLVVEHLLDLEQIVLNRETLEENFYHLQLIMTDAIKNGDRKAVERCKQIIIILLENGLDQKLVIEFFIKQNLTPEIIVLFNEHEQIMYRSLVVNKTMITNALTFFKQLPSECQFSFCDNVRLPRKTFNSKTFPGFLYETIRSLLSKFNTDKELTLNPYLRDKIEDVLAPNSYNTPNGRGEFSADECRTLEAILHDILTLNFKLLKKLMMSDFPIQEPTIQIEWHGAQQQKNLITHYFSAVNKKSAPMSSATLTIPIRSQLNHPETQSLESLPLPSLGYSLK